MWEGGNCLKHSLTKIKAIGSKKIKDYKLKKIQEYVPIK